MSLLSLNSEATLPIVALPGNRVAQKYPMVINGPQPHVPSYAMKQRFLDHNLGYTRSIHSTLPWHTDAYPAVPFHPLDRAQGQPFKGILRWAGGEVRLDVGKHSGRTDPNGRVFLTLLV